MELKFVKEQRGWRLVTDNPLTYCRCCGKLLQIPFFYCKEFDIGFCRKCEYDTPKRLCKSMQREHEHFNIIQFVNQKTL